MWECGLKQRSRQNLKCQIQSLLMWECGLKPATAEVTAPEKVTPYVGVWIETVYIFVLSNQLHVTPYVGVWIETHPERQPRSTRKSLLMWECGLKPLWEQRIYAADQVTPYVGVWIETSLICE